MPTPKELISNIDSFLSTPGTLYAPIKNAEIDDKIKELNELVRKQSYLNNAIIYFALLSDDLAIKSARDELLQLAYMLHVEDINEMVEEQKELGYSGDDGDDYDFGIPYSRRGNQTAAANSYPPPKTKLRNKAISQYLKPLKDMRLSNLMRHLKSINYRMNKLQKNPLNKNDQ